MPCNTSRLLEVKLDKCDASTMTQALAAQGLTPRLVGSVIHFGANEWIDTKSGQAKLSTSRDVNEIKRAYSEQIVRKSKRFGWALKQTGQNKFEIQKR